MQGMNCMSGINSDPAFISWLALCLNFLFLEIIPNLQGSQKNSS